MLDVISRRPVRLLSEDDLYIWEEDAVGDLGAKLVPPENSTSAWANVRDLKAELVSDNRIFNQGRRIEYRCGEAPDLSCLVYGDSFALLLLPYLAESFGRLVFAHIPTLDYGLVELEKPDVAVFVLNERFLFSVPSDLGAPTLDELAAEKRSAKQVLAPRTWIGSTRVDTPAEGLGEEQEWARPST
jgi:hypothetical protein